MANYPLLDCTITDLPGEYRDMRARDFWQNGVGWDFTRIRPYISENTKLKLSAVVLDNVTGVKDRLSWRASIDGRFTVRSAYAFLTRNQPHGHDM